MVLRPWRLSSWRFHGTGPDHRRGWPTSPFSRAAVVVGSFCWSSLSTRPSRASIRARSYAGAPRTCRRRRLQRSSSRRPPPRLPRAANASRITSHEQAAPRLLAAPAAPFSSASRVKNIFATAHHADCMLRQTGAYIARLSKSEAGLVMLPVQNKAKDLAVAISDVFSWKRYQLAASLLRA
jgi:hypothetical protein